MILACRPAKKNSGTNATQVVTMLARIAARTGLKVQDQRLRIFQLKKQRGLCGRCTTEIQGLVVEVDGFYL